MKKLVDENNLLDKNKERKDDCKEFIKEIDKIGLVEYAKKNNMSLSTVRDEYVKVLYYMSYGFDGIAIKLGCTRQEAKELCISLLGLELEATEHEGVDLLGTVGMTNIGYDNLVVALVRQAVTDYRNYMLDLNKPMLSIKRRGILKDEIREIETFLSSSVLLSGQYGRYILETLHKETNDLYGVKEVKA